MSLTTVTAKHKQQIQAGEKISSKEFVQIVQTSLPLAWQVVKTLAQQMKAEKRAIIFNPKTLDDAARGELHRMFASNAIRKTVQQHFGIRKLAFQNCHAVGAFPETPEGKEEYQKFTSIEAQILAQTPELRDC